MKEGGKKPGAAESRLELDRKKGNGGAHVKVDVEVLESLLKLENLEASLRYVLKKSTRTGRNMFQLFDTSEKPNHFVASRRRWLESQGQESGQNEWHDIEYQGARQKPGRAPKGP